MDTTHVTGKRRHVSLRTCAITVAAVLSLTGCGGGSQKSAALLPQPDRAGSSAPSTPAAHHPKASCRMERRPVAYGGVEHDPRIACTRPHNQEVISTHPLYGKATRAAIQAYVAPCNVDLTNTLGLDDQGVFRASVTPVGVPTKPGHVAVECEVSLLGGVGVFFHRPLAVTMSSLVALGQHRSRSETLWCTDAVPTASGSAFVDCGRPHLAQARVPSLTTPAPGKQYPAAQIRAHGQAECRTQVARLPQGSTLASYAWWWNIAIWTSNGKPDHVPGACWYFRTDHHDLPAVR
jgi:hypothetical protein